ncbi:hypothetical protein BDV35DRAFT_382002 [Aspergillus flavus]|uniref:Clr5 domain-containing protein n=1 Tax=Aspergillus flavus TaxID=5059 RepID=A0A5N6GS12_ASPFL|nr:hypothetical protein BDV35DRAFT_382002 [Aspergillus flavus]
MDGSIPPPSAISPISPSPSTSSAIFRPRRSDDWHEYRPIIEQLYRDNQLKLRDVKRIMERRAESQSQSPPQLQLQSQPETQPQTHRSSPEPEHLWLDSTGKRLIHIQGFQKPVTPGVTVSRKPQEGNPSSRLSSILRDNDRHRMGRTVYAQMKHKKASDISYPASQQTRPEIISASESNKQPSSDTETTRNGAGSHFIPRLGHWHSASLSQG